MATHTKDFYFQEMAQDRHKKGIMFLKLLNYYNENVNRP
jgi:hypothetical protein